MNNSLLVPYILVLLFFLFCLFILFGIHAHQLHLKTNWKAYGTIFFKELWIRMRFIFRNRCFSRKNSSLKDFRRGRRYLKAQKMGSGSRKGKRRADSSIPLLSHFYMAVLKKYIKGDFDGAYSDFFEDSLKELKIRIESRSWHSYERQAIDVYLAHYDQLPDPISKYLKKSTPQFLKDVEGLKMKDGSIAKNTLGCLFDRYNQLKLFKSKYSKELVLKVGEVALEILGISYDMKKWESYLQYPSIKRLGKDHTTYLKKL